MPLPAPFWPLLALLILTGMLCRRWPLVSLLGALGAFCATMQVLLWKLPSDDWIVLADSILFVLPTLPLVVACGWSELRGTIVFALVPIAIGIHLRCGSEARSIALPIMVATVQGAAAISGIASKSWKPRIEFGTQRWAATCIAAIGLVGIGFSPVWTDVAWTGVAAHAFACLAYLAEEQRE